MRSTRHVASCSSNEDFREEFFFWGTWPIFNCQRLRKLLSRISLCVPAFANGGQRRAVRGLAERPSRKCGRVRWEAAPRFIFLRPNNPADGARRALPTGYRMALLDVGWEGRDGLAFKPGASVLDSPRPCLIEGGTDFLLVERTVRSLSFYVMGRPRDQMTVRHFLLVFHVQFHWMLSRFHFGWV